MRLEPFALLVGAALATADIALPAPAARRVWRRLLQAAPAAVLALACRGADAPTLLVLALAASAAAFAMSEDAAREASAGEVALATVAGLLLAAFLFELADLRLLAAQPWRLAGAAGVALTAVVVLRRRPAQGPVAPLAALPIGALALCAVFAVLVEAGFLPLPAGVILLVAAWAVQALGRGAPRGLPVARALRSGGVLLLAWPALRPF